MTIMHWYTAGWLLLCAIAAFMLIRQPHKFAILSSQYRGFICEPWKLITAITATIAMTVMAPYTGDPTWDYFDAFYMSFLTWATAPWCVGILYRFARRLENGVSLHVAICLWFFSASWSYDLYIWIRDGYYPMTWTSNIVASSFLYLMAGILWNLAWNRERGLHLAFMTDEWPVASQAASWRIAWIALPIILLVGVLMGRFLMEP